MKSIIFISQTRDLFCKLVFLKFNIRKKTAEEIKKLFKKRMKNVTDNTYDLKAFKETPLSGIFRERFVGKF
jgi:hypothetical protein